jgi:hypothetical protein
LARLVHPVKIRHRRVQREETVERQGWRRTLQCQPLVAAQLSPVRVAGRGDDAEPVERATQDDHKQPRVAALGMGDARH